MISYDVTQLCFFSNEIASKDPESDIDIGFDGLLNQFSIRLAEHLAP